MKELDFIFDHIEKIIEWIKLLFKRFKNSKAGYNLKNKKDIRDIYKKTKKLIRLKKSNTESSKSFDITFKKYCIMLNDFIVKIYASTECEEQRFSLHNVVSKLDSSGDKCKISFRKFYGSLKQYKKDKNKYDVFYDNIFFLIKPLYDTLTDEQKIMFKSKISVNNKGAN